MWYPVLITSSPPLNAHPPVTPSPHLPPLQQLSVYFLEFSVPDGLPLYFPLNLFEKHLKIRVNMYCLLYAEDVSNVFQWRKAQTCPRDPVKETSLAFYCDHNNIRYK